MTAPTVPASRAARDLLSLARDLPDMDEAELAATEDRAAREFAAYALHSWLPTERQGDQSRQAFVLRQECQDAARDLWLAVQAERGLRRDVGALTR